MLLTTPNPPITFVQGDTPTLSLTATTDQGLPIDLTGATFSTQINGPNGESPIVFPNSQHTADPDQVNNTGQFTLALSSDDTTSCGEGAHKEILTEITIGTDVMYCRGNNLLTVYPPIPLQ